MSPYIYTDTHLLRTVVTNFVVECIGRAKTPTATRWDEPMYIYIWYNHSGHWPYKTTAIRYMSPQLRRICAQGRNYIYIYMYIYIYCAVQLRRNILQRLHWPLTAMFPNAPLQHSEVLHLYGWYTHTPRNSGADEMKMKVRWQWKWNESYLTSTRRGERKRRGQEQTPTQTAGPERANAERAREKKSGGRRTRNKTSGGGGRRKRLNQPTTAKPKPT